jgi:hypothetical protein
MRAIRSTLTCSASFSGILGQGRCGEARKKGEKVILVAIPPSKPMSKIEQTMVLLVG